MTVLKGRLERSAAVLAVIDQRRRQTHDPSLGSAAEHYLVERELKELADEAAAAAGGTSAEIRPRKRRAVLLATAGRWLRRSGR